MRKLGFVLLAVMLVFALVVPVAAQDAAVVAQLEAYQATIPPYGTIAPADVVTAIAERDVLLLDVREIEEYEAGHIEGAFNVPIRTLGENLNLLPDIDAEIIVICQGGARAMLAQASLRSLGYNNAMTMTGGMGSWVGENLPTVTEAFVPEASEAPEFDGAVYEAVNSYLTNMPQGYGLVRADALNEELFENPDIILIDVRSPEEWATGYIAGADHIWINEFMASVDMWPEDKDAPIVVYCASGYRGGIATVMMNLMGYTNVRNVSGGIGAWIAAGLPLEGVPEETASDFDFAAIADAYLSDLPENFNAVRPDGLAEELASDDAPFVVDVRTVDEYTESHIEGAINVPLNELTQSLDLLPAQDANIVVYCGSGHRSALAMEALNLLGYTNTRSLLTGFGGWTGAGNAVSDVPVEAEMGMAPEIDPDLFAAVDGYITSIPDGYYVVRADALNEELFENEIFLIDVRTDGEFNSGYIEGAVHIPLEQFVASMDQWPEDMAAAVVIYDNPTHRSTMAMEIMQILGYENVRTLGGGFGAWSSADLPVATP
ncbi:MAG: rhodanese-like domain-containing protein [Anaerolineae bacterium]|nr:rhodanese-like domain-containing protein [Anaerolineae bacterium]MCA9891588.1 rhodanese-like domain-containing protein [Anaerolineae bacterium]